MEEPTLVILAAGMGSRFGGLKQITAVDERGHAIIDYSLFDAHRAGFKKVCFIIKHEIEADFKKAVGTRMERYFDVSYVYQQLDRLPEGYTVPEGRVKPFGTGHAVACCKGTVDGPFVVINADDFYGASAYRSIYEYLTQEHSSGEHAMIAFHLRNTVTENGSVARGVCTVENGLLTDVVERTKIVKCGSDAAYTEDGEHFTPLSGDCPVSMNFWGFQNSMLDELCSRFPVWLDETLPTNPLKAEYFLPFVVSDVLKEKCGSVQVLESQDQWLGVTYREDLPNVISAIAELRSQGLYPETLLD